MFLPQSIIQKPIKTILRDMETGEVIERSTYKVILSGLLLPHAVNAILKNLLAHFEAISSDFSVVLSTDPNTSSLTFGIEEPTPQTFLHRIDFDAIPKRAKYGYLDSRSIL